MNYYFLLEDEKSFLKVLPKWLEFMGFNCTRVMDIEHVKENNYVLQSGQGVTQLITKVLYQTLDTIVNKDNLIQHLVIIVDAEEIEPIERLKQIKEKIDEYCEINDLVLNFDIKIIVCNKCFETWLLGNKSIYPKEVPDGSSFFYEYYTHYNVSNQDPENMQLPNNYDITTAQYHFRYFHEACRYLKHRYSKSKPDYVATNEYFSGIVDRMLRDKHIQSFAELWKYIQEQCNKESNLC